MRKEYEYIGSYDGVRENNFTPIRLAFAWLVLYGHSFAIQKVPGFKDPLHHIFSGSTWIGEISVNGFFLISGFLVTASFINRGAVEYIFSRAIRIYPALIICILITVFILGMAVTDLNIKKYLTNQNTWSYLKNSMAILPMQWSLPGVFHENSRISANGSLWTLTVETRCYILLAIAGICGAFKNKYVSNLTILMLFIIGLSAFKEVPLIGTNKKWSTPCLYFLLGVFTYVNRSKIILDAKLALLASIIMAYSFGKDYFQLTFPLSFTYITFYLAYKSRYIPLDKYIGDISYGVYIYAWPCQQLIAHIFPDENPYFNMLFSSIITAILAYGSWRYIENPALSIKNKTLKYKQSKKSLQSKG